MRRCDRPGGAPSFACELTATVPYREEDVKLGSRVLRWRCRRDADLRRDAINRESQSAALAAGVRWTEAMARLAGQWTLTLVRVVCVRPQVGPTNDAIRMCAHAGIACALCGVQSRVGCRVNYVMRRSVGRAASDGVAWIHAGSVSVG